MKIEINHYHRTHYINLIAIMVYAFFYYKGVHGAAFIGVTSLFLLDIYYSYKGSWSFQRATKNALRLSEVSKVIIDTAEELSEGERLRSAIGKKLEEKGLGKG